MKRAEFSTELKLKHKLKSKKWQKHENKKELKVRTKFVENLDTKLLNMD